MDVKLIEPYLLGCLLGDGGLHGNLTFASKDEDIISHVCESLKLYGYTLIKRTEDPKRNSEYSIRPLERNTVKYKFIYKNNAYTSAEICKILQNDGYKITSHDTLLSLVGKSTRTKKSNILKYYPELNTLLSCEQVKDSQHSEFIDLLNSYNLRCRFDEKRIPEEYFGLSTEERLLLFQGLMDTDGCGSNYHLEFCVANKLLAEDFIRLAESLGYTAKLTIRQPKYFNKKYNELRFGHIAYRVSLNNIPEIQPFLCQRKLDKYHTMRRKNHGTNTSSKI